MIESYDKEGALFRIVAVGGTFDELHKGHKVLLITAFKYGENVWIGLCTDEFAKKLRKNHEIASYEDRAKELADFLNDLGVSDRAKIIPLSDPYGPAATSAVIEAIVVSKETEPRARELNSLRLGNGLKPLKIIVIDMVPAEDQIPISTTRIRWGEIDREGKLLRKRIN
ncbi:phosphopantetheine adenylyltransferase [Candidatus Bathyarchaeota archaeon]|nr:phosphopantetheine adenylyltransferase [Candidatus Bathyarchaeota archaeon]